jgi:AmmeMemoRadiSam system protein A
MGLEEKDRQELLALARRAVAAALQRGQPPSLDPGQLSEELCSDGACFVTITKDGTLRGCIGSLEAHQPLAEDVRENAIAAAVRDPRFPPLSTAELDQVCFEVSVLSAPQRLEYEGLEDLLAKLRPGIDGVLIQSGFNRATFLPQVWEKLPDPHLFLQQLCLKAGLPPNAYRRGELEVFTYQAEKFAESQPVSPAART